MSAVESWWPLIRDTVDYEEIGQGLAEFLAKPEPWKRLAACRNEDPDLFFPRQGQHSTKAKMVCMTCIVKDPCREYQERTRSLGVWAGELHTEAEIRSVQDARPVRIARSEGTGQGEAVNHQGFGSIASRLPSRVDPGPA